MKFIKSKRRLVLSYIATQSGSSWIYDSLEQVGWVRIKKRFWFEAKHLLTKRPEEGSGDDFEPVKFRIARLDGEYFKVDKKILGLNNNLHLHKDLKIDSKIFFAERDISVFGRIDKVVADPVYIGGPHEGAISEEGFNYLLSRFPTSREMTNYADARVSSAISEYLTPKRDYLEKFQKLRNRRPSRKLEDFYSDVSEFELEKFEGIYQKLKAMLDAEESYSEKEWQDEILQILLLLNPKYICIFDEVSMPDSDTFGSRRVDFLLVDSIGHVDIVEIKKPFDRCVVSERLYRGSHIPLRELSGTIMQVEKYIRHLNRWGKQGEAVLSNRLREKLPGHLSIKITNPSGIIITGRSANLSPEQLRDFEVIRRKYTNIIDIVTYDDLLGRLHQLSEYWRTKV